MASAVHRKERKPMRCVKFSATVQRSIIVWAMTGVVWGDRCHHLNFQRNLDCQHLAVC